MIKSSVCFALEPDPGLKLDTLSLKEGQVLIVNNQKYIIKNDTVIYIPSSVKYEVRRSRGDIFYDNLAREADKWRWTRELHNIIIAKHGSNANSDTLKTIQSVAPFILFKGRPIRNIKIRRLNVFGPTIDDTTRLPRTWLENTINKGHFESKEYLIRNNLLFKEGDALNPAEIADNERLLRGLPYIDDAKIIVNNSGNLNDSVDVLVLSKDVMAKAFDVKINDVHSGQFQMWDNNIFGFGHGNQNNILWNSQDNPSAGYQGLYTINNIGGTFFTGTISYYNSFHTESFGLQAVRSFFTPNVKYAGGISLLNTQTLTLFKFDTIFKETPLRYNTYDSWIGRSFLINRNSFSKLRQNITLAARIKQDKFFERPTISANSYYNYQDKTLILASLSYTLQSFFKSNFIYNFGRTEDIPVGSEVQITLGFENNEFLNRRYAGFKMASGNFGDLGYIYSELDAGSFINVYNKLEQSVISAGLKYFSPLILYQRYHFRQFVNFDYTLGMNRFSNEYLTIDENSGLAGVENDSVRGVNRFNIHWETVCFTPWTVLDFKFVLFVAADHSWIGNRSDFYNAWPYTDIGIGMRIRNLRLVFNTIQIKFSLYPNIPSGSKTSFINVAGETLLSPPGFLPQEPALITFQ